MGERIDARQLLAGAVEGDWRTVFTEIDCLAREGDWGALADVRTRALELRGAPLASVRERIENRAAADAEGAAALARWLAPESLAPRRAGELADRLAQALAWPAIAALGFRDPILWQAAHARILRRDDLAQDPAARRLAAAAGAAGDPLAALPLTPNAIESGALLPVLTPDGMTWSLPFGPHLEGLSPVVPAQSWLTPRRMKQEALPAFGHWGHVDGAIGVPAGAATPGGAAGAFAALLPEICRETGPVRVLEVSPPDAWAFLLCAAFAGDAAPRRNAADARLAAWRTLAGFADAPDAPPAAVAAFAAGARWYVLDVASAWFTRRARDAALVGHCRTHWAAAAATEA